MIAQKPLPAPGLGVVAAVAEVVAPVPRTTPPISSPIRTSTDSTAILNEFFGWYRFKYAGLNWEQVVTAKEKVLAEDWDLDDLRPIAKGGMMTATIWESYGLKLGTLNKIQKRISEFKQVRGGSPGSITESDKDIDEGDLT